MRHNTDSKSLKIVLKLHLVIPLKFTGTHRAHLLNGEVEDYRLLDPLVHLPLALLKVDRLSRAKFSLIDSLNHLTYGLFGCRLREQVAVLPRALDERFQSINITFHSFVIF